MSKAGKRYMQLQYQNSQEYVKESRWYLKFWLLFFLIPIIAIFIFAYFQIWIGVFILVVALVGFCVIWSSMG